VFHDEGGEGEASARSSPMPGVHVLLDDGRRAVTDREGRFRFADAGAAPRRVEAVLPAAEGARFTSPSTIIARGGDDVVFRIGHVAARLIGSIRDDAAAPIRGAHVRVACAGGEATAVSGGDGRFSISRAEGECRVQLDPASLPAGYTVNDEAERIVTLARGVPAHADYVLEANRSLAGVVTGRDARTGSVRLLETGAERRPDEDGRFIFRNLKPGEYTLTAEIDGRTIVRVVVIPDGPAIVNVTLGPN
jgi:hypothetical protein